jgi:diguanylate cyclase (GGDEF)-like protein
MPANRLNLEDFPNSAYAHELRRGLGDLRFGEPLEAEYRVAHVQRVRPRVRIWYSMNVVLSVLFTADQVRRDGVWNVLSLAHLGLLVPCTAALVWLVWSRYYERWYLPASRVLGTSFNVLVAAFVAVALAREDGQQLGSLTVILIGAFFFSGLMFRQALLTAAMILIAFAAAAMAASLDTAALVKGMVILMATSGIAAIIYRDVEQAYRRNFLEDALISELVTRDGLSGLMNRRAFDEHLQRVWQQALRDQRSVALFIIDIDHFKRHNDEWGHQAGDLALRNVAQAIQGFAHRPLDLAARYGGEEFALILYDMPLLIVHELAERLREAVQNLHITPREVREVREAAATQKAAAITVSVGVGLGVPSIGRTPQGLVQLADEALYEAKQAGRNRIVVRDADAYKMLDTGVFNSRDIRPRR